jgi:hypothetical protein
VVDNYGASLLEVSNNYKYRNVKKAITREEKEKLDLEELEIMMRNERAGMQYGQQMPKKKFSLNV